ncbi:hypothetical protein [Spirosoma endophyticum]|uniref:Uncharacterized protein n=1 Tax=Spirosoma endophyticum TaxID=662367 RepID=A0A1I1GV56_9BACT|nr:hypothetical protein [Spirosoma endophyticum]SFC15172.1 hypothetical protein SAMN05216167_101557 [Spirosoma endophyticum]
MTVSSPELLHVLDWTIQTIRFVKKHFLIIFGLGLVAAFGRAIQLRAFGPVSPLSHTLLEMVIEGARILLFFYALGLTNVRTGANRLMQLFTNKQARKQSWRVATQNVRKKWFAMLINFVVFLIIAFLFNVLINHIAYETCLYITLKSRQIISDQTSEWAIILFFKNISVIPFTLIFNALFLLWLVNRLPKSVAY